LQAIDATIDTGNDKVTTTTTTQLSMDWTMSYQAAGVVDDIAFDGDAQ